MEEIYKLSIQYGFNIIEDASHAIGGSYRNTKVGSCKYSDITVFSFHPVKIITSGEGGISTTNDPNLARKMKAFSNHGITKDFKEFIGSSKELWNYEMQCLGFNYRLTDLQCARISQLKKLNQVVEKRNLILKDYKRLLSNDSISILEIPKDVRSAVHLAYFN